jgi:hypothetical protein
VLAGAIGANILFGSIGKSPQCSGVSPVPVEISPPGGALLQFAFDSGMKMIAVRNCF